MKNNRAVDFSDDQFYFIDQTKLPLVEETVCTSDYERIAAAIERLEVRGAPAIGVAAAFAIALSIKGASAVNSSELFEKACVRLASTRPTAVNLFYAINEMKKSYASRVQGADLYSLLVSRAKEIHESDIELCEKIALNGLDIFSGRKKNVLTHCNAGFLATGGDGTALNVIRTGFVNGFISHVYADETRPLLQGSRLTAWELKKAGIPFSINTDSTAAYLMQQGKVDLVVVGADRIAVNGDAANKIGTYSLAVLCSYHKIPFYIAAPTTTIDANCISGKDIKIELRDKSELTRIGGVDITSGEFPAYCPAFDVTPHELITAVITEKRIHKPPFNFSNV